MAAACLSSISIRRVPPTVGLGVNANTVENTIYTALFDISVDPHDVVQHTAFENIDVIPANIDLSAAEVQLVTEVGREQILNSVLRKLKSEYDLTRRLPATARCSP